VLSRKNTNENLHRIGVENSYFYVVDVLLVRNLIQLTGILGYSSGNNKNRLLPIVTLGGHVSSLVAHLGIPPYSNV
jgi:hypothetical protein